MTENITQPPPIPDPTGPTDRPPTEVPVNMTDLYIGGSLLLTLSVIFTFVNGFLIWLAFFKNWTAITRSKFFNSFFLGLVLSVTDLVLAVLVGFPASLHLTWMSYFRMQPSMPFYSMYIGHFLFIFIFNFRVLIVALMSLDSFFHIKFPLLYEAGYDSRKNVHVACIVAAAIPIVFKIIPNVVWLLQYDTDSGISCIQVNDSAASLFNTTNYPERYYVPLTCYISLPNGEHNIVRADVAITATIIVVSWFILFSTNVASLLIALKKLRSVTQTARATLLICWISFVFMLSNFPPGVLSLMSYLANYGYEFAKTAHVTNKVEFYITLLPFLSLIFHPWFFVLRLKSFRELLIRFKIKVIRSVRSSRGFARLSLFVRMNDTQNRSQRDSDRSVDPIELNGVCSPVVISNRSAFSQDENIQRVA